MFLHLNGSDAISENIRYCRRTTPICSINQWGLRGYIIQYFEYLFRTVLFMDIFRKIFEFNYTKATVGHLSHTPIQLLRRA